MPQIAVKDNDRLSMRISAEDKQLIMRAAAIKRVNVTEFMVSNSVSSAQQVIREAEQIELSERDSLHLMELLDDPPKPNKKLLAAAFALPK